LGCCLKADLRVSAVAERLVRRRPTATEHGSALGL
jgi:hypothetical protein